MCPKDVDGIAISGDLIRLPTQYQADLDLHCMPDLSV